MSNVTAGDKAVGSAKSVQNTSNQHFVGDGDGSVYSSYNPDEDDGQDDEKHGEFLDDVEGCENMHEGRIVRTLGKLEMKRLAL